MIGLKVITGENISKIISILRKYDKTLSISDIKQKIENRDIVISHDISSVRDISDELAGIDRNELFCKLLQELINNNVEIELYHDTERITTEIFSNMLRSWDEICRQTEYDIDIEADKI